MHLTHTDVVVDHRILRSMKAGTAAGHDVTALGIAQSQPSDAALQRARELGVTTAVRPRLLGRRLLAAEQASANDHLEVSQGRTGPLRRIGLLLWMTGRAMGHARRHKPQIVHAHDTVVLPIAVLLRVFFRAKVIYDAHELESDKAGGSRLQNRLILTVEKICWPWVRGFITVSEAIGDWYAERFGAPRALIILNSPESHAAGSPSQTGAGDVRSQIGAGEDDLIFLYVGALESGRGIEELITVFSQPQVTGTFAILGDGSIREHLKSLAQGHDNIRVLDPVAHSALVGYIATADYGFALVQNISLSDYLCLPNKLFEYLHSGLTVVCSDFPEMARIVNENQFGYAVSEDVDSITSLVESLTRQPRPAKIDFSRIQEFTWDAQARKLQDLYSII